ncbi:hypothetical protein Q8A73_001479 [Channa argus]|nr:hypothetical protein Q8A73_001479 [Channa argus]
MEDCGMNTLEIRAASPPPLPHGPSNHATPTVARQPDNAGASGCGVRVREFVFCLYALKIRNVILVLELFHTRRRHAHIRSLLPCVPNSDLGDCGSARSRRGCFCGLEHESIASDELAVSGVSLA